MEILRTESPDFSDFWTENVIFRRYFRTESSDVEDILGFYLTAFSL